jgi:transcriptional regulator with XRE-family HTH domain
MQDKLVRPGRPLGSVTADPVLAAAFGSAVRSARTARGVAQETLANLAGIERSHVGKIERGEHMPTLAAVLKLAAAMDMPGADLVAAAQALLPEGHAAHRRAGRSST